MTRQAIVHRDTEYINWLRNHPELDSAEYGYSRQDIDIVWFAYKTGNIMLISEKSYAAEPTDDERDVYGIVHQALRYSCDRIEFTRVFPSRPRLVTYHGCHLVQFQHLGPEDGWTKINGHIVTPEQLLDFHRFRYFPGG